MSPTKLRSFVAGIRDPDSPMSVRHGAVRWQGRFAVSGLVVPVSRTSAGFLSGRVLRDGPPICTDRRPAGGCFVPIDVRLTKQRLLGGGTRHISRLPADHTDVLFLSTVVTHDSGSNLWDCRSSTNGAGSAHSAGTVPVPRLRSFGWFLQLPVWRRGSEPRS